MTSEIPDPDIVRLSGDSHVLEPEDLWFRRLPAKFRDQAFHSRGRYERVGGRDPKAALRDAAADGISAQVLFPSSGQSVFRQFYRRQVDVDLAKACDRVYNDWLIEYCSEDCDRLWGLALIGLWDVDYAIKEMVRTREAGLKGVMTWTAPPDDLPFSGDHYERFWSAAEEMGVPICMHINYGFGEYVNTRDAEDRRAVIARQAYGHKYVAQKTAAELILFGAFERHPNLKILFAEFDCGWIPFFVEDLDRKFMGWRAEGERNSDRRLGLELLPSEYFSRNICSTFMQDGTASYLLGRWGGDNFVYSNDYPHGGGAWPYTDETIALMQDDVPKEVRRKVLGENLARWFGQPLPPPVERQPLVDYSEELPPQPAAVRPDGYVPADSDWRWVRPWLKRAGEFTFEKEKMGLAQ